MENKILNTFDIVPENWGFVYVATDIKTNKFYIGSHKGNNRDYKGSGIIITRILQKRSKDIIITPIFFHPIELVVRVMEDYFLKLFSVAENNLFYNLKNSAVGGNMLLSKTEHEKKEIYDRILQSRKITLANRSIEKSQEIYKRQRTTLLKNILQHSLKIKNTLSKRTPQQEYDRQLKNLKSRYLKGKISLIEVVDSTHLSRGVYFGAEKISSIYPITSNGVRLNIVSDKPIRQGILKGWKFIQLPKQSWEEVVEHAKNVLNEGKTNLR